MLYFNIERIAISHCCSNIKTHGKRLERIDKEFKYFLPKTLRKYWLDPGLEKTYPGSLIRLLGSKKHWIPDPQHGY
jgi:hypothetical protein